MSSGCAPAANRSPRADALRLVLLLLFASSVAHAADGIASAGVDPSDPNPSSLCTEAILAAEQRHGLPKGLLGAIAKVESGRPITAMSDVRPWPWTIDADGAGLFFDTKREALAWMGGPGRTARSVDIGCLQVNLQAHPRAFASLDRAFDPTENADYAARYLRELNDEARGDWTIATGLYHSHSPMLAADYRARVAEVGAGILTGSGGYEPLYRRALRQGTLRLALAGGGVLLINTARQPVGRRPNRKSPCEVAAILAPLLHAPPRMAGCR